MLKSSSLMSQVVKRLGINYTCTRDDMFKKITYFEDAPVELGFIVHGRAWLYGTLKKATA